MPGQHQQRAERLFVFWHEGMLYELGPRFAVFVFLFQQRLRRRMLALKGKKSIDGP
jgi:hypothetical protein